MLLDLFLVLAGLVLLGGGGEVLVRGAIGLARALRVTPAVIGLTIVSAGTSFPELVVSLLANLRGSPDVAVGNVLGSNIFNIGLILGTSALFITFPIARKTLRLEWPLLLVISLLAAALMGGGAVSRGEGILLLIVLILFNVGMVHLSRREFDEEEKARGPADVGPDSKRGISIALTLLGLVLLPAGAELVVRGAVGIAASIGVSERLVGLTVVAMGTSLPELASSLVAAARGRTDVAVGNVIGSNVFNLAAIMGTTAVIKPLQVQAVFLRSDVIWMLGFTLLLAPLIYFDRKIGRADGVVLLGMFLVYMSILILGTAAAAT